MHTHTCSLCRSYKHGHTHSKHTYTHTHTLCREEGLWSMCWLCSQWGGLFAGHKGARERDGVCDFPLSCPFFLPLTVRWMIAITGAISETEWRSMGQRDTAMGNQPSDYCTALPWEHCAVYLSRGFVVSYAFSSLSAAPPPTPCGLLMYRT